VVLDSSISAFLTQVFYIILVRSLHFIFDGLSQIGTVFEAFPANTDQWKII